MFSFDGTPNLAVSELDSCIGLSCESTALQILLRHGWELHGTIKHTEIRGQLLVLAEPH